MMYLSCWPRVKDTLRFCIEQHPQWIPSSAANNLSMGFHDEHHDFPMAPWSKLSHLYRLAPEFYQTLFAHQSYTRLLGKFIFDKNISAFSRWVRSDAEKHEAPAGVSQSPVGTFLTRP